MDNFKLKTENFGNFIKNTKNKIIGRFNELNSVDITCKTVKLLPGFVKKVVDSLNILTTEGKIIWTEDFWGNYNGIFIADTIFSDCKIIVQKWKEDFKEEYYFKISFIKFISDDKKVEYTSNAANNREFKELINSIKIKIQLDKN
mgnify:CR=1 FL=1